MALPFSSAEDGCAKQSRVDEALQLLEEMKSSGAWPRDFLENPRDQLG